MATVHIESKKEDIASVVLMPGDPKRSEYIAKHFLLLLSGFVQSGYPRQLLLLCPVMARR